MIGAVIIAVGLLSYLRASGFINSELVAPLLLLVIGVGMIIFGIFVYARRGRRFPTPFVQMSAGKWDGFNLSLLSAC